MSWNNIVPTWILGKYSDAYDSYDAGKISLRQFYDVIKELPEVPYGVKERWKSKMSEVVLDQYTAYYDNE